MRRKLLIVLILFIGVFHLDAQTVSSDSFSKNEVRSFTEIYRYKLDNAFDVVTAMKSRASQIAISEERMSEILQAQFAGNPITLSENEQRELNKFQLLLEQDRTAHQVKIDAFIRAKNVSPSDYQRMEKVFRNDNNLRERVRKQAKTN